MLKPLLLGLTVIGLASCAAPHSQRFMAMSPEELAAYNATVPESEQVTCIRQHRPAMGSIRKVCSKNEKRLARIFGVVRSADDPFYGTGDSGFFNTRSSFSSRGGNQPRIHFSPPPAGYDRPVIHVIDGRRY